MDSKFMLSLMSGLLLIVVVVWTEERQLRGGMGLEQLLLWWLATVGC